MKGKKKQEGEEEGKREREKFCAVNVKYKEISWRVRRREGGGKK